MVNILPLLVIGSLLAVGNRAQTPNYLVIFPEVLQIANEQKVVVSVFDVDSNVPVKVQVEAFDESVIYQTNVQDVTKDKPGIFTVKVPYKSVPEPSQSGARYLYIRAISEHVSLPFNKRKRVVLGLKSMSVFIQTDKPVYVSDDDVHIRFVAVRSDLKQLGDPVNVTIWIKNPQNLIVDRFDVIASSSDNPVIKKHQLKLGHSPILGEWTIVAKYGYKKSATSEVRFEVKDYVLPRFDVRITPPDNVHNNKDKHIVFTVESLYTYGKPVVGNLNVTVGVGEENTGAIQRFRTSKFFLDFKDKGKRVISYPNDGYGVFPEGKLLYIFAEMTEKASGIKQSTSDKSAYFSANPIVIDCSISQPFYKPTLPLTFLIQTKYANGKPAPKQTVEVSLRHNDDRAEKTSDENGLAGIRLNVGKSNNQEITALAKVRGQNVSEECRFKLFEDPCNDYLAVNSKKPDALPKGSKADFEIIKVKNSGNDVFVVNVVVLSCGAVQDSFTFKSNVESVTNFQVRVAPEFCKRMCVLVYKRSNCDKNHIAADFTCVDVEEKCSNDITLELTNKGKSVQPGQDTKLTIKAAKHSDIALLAVDKGLYILNNKTKLGKQEIFEELLRYDKSCGYSGNNVQGIFTAAGLATISGIDLNTVDRETESCPVKRRKRSADPTEAEACLCKLGRQVQDNVLASSSLQRAEKSLVERCNTEYKNLNEGKSTLKTDCLVTRTGTWEFLKCCSPEHQLASLRARSGSSAYDILNTEGPSFITRRTYFPHVWLWDLSANTGSSGRVEATLDVPDSITDWSIQGLALSKSGFCAATPVTLRAFRPVFLECHLPFSLRRQEQVAVACTAFFYNVGESRACMQIVKPEEDICTTAGKGESTDAFCFTITAPATRTVLFPIVPLKTGISKLRVRLTTELSGDEIETDIRVEPEGVPREYSFSTELDPQGVNMEGGPRCSSKTRLKDFRIGNCFRRVNANSECMGKVDELQVTKKDCCDKKIGDFSVAWSDGSSCELCPQEATSYDCLAAGRKRQTNSYYVRVPENYVAGSDTAWISVTGKYLQGTITVVESVEELLRLPSGCGEQAIAKFAPNVAIVKHLKAAGELFVEVRDKYIDYIKKGYQHQLQYRKPSGAFAIYQDYPASTWLSAFVLQSFCDAKDFAVIDDDVIRGLVTFLTTRQVYSGAILDTYHVHAQYMIGGIQGGDASLTAYVLNGMLQCCEAPGYPFFTPNATNAICKAVTFLELYVENNAVKRPYSRALVYSALVKACSCNICSCKPHILQKARAQLDSDAAIREDGSKYWPANTDLGRSHWYSHKPNAIEVETTSYALCAYVANNDIKSARPLAKWLNSVRSGHGAFISTQDTVVALRCLAEFSNAIQMDQSLVINITAVNDQTFSRVFKITENNKNIDQRIEIPRNDILKVETTGSGLGMLQVNVEYNSPETDNERCQFEFSVTPEEDQDSGKFLVLNVCAQYNGSEVTDQAIIEVDLPTGYEGNNHSLSELLASKGQDLGFDKYEITGRGVTFYFKQIGSTAESRTCFKFKAEQMYEARSLTSVSAKIYYYYRKEESCTIFYTVDGASPDLAVLCGSNGKGSKEPLCICGAGRCPRLETIQNRMCNACSHHDYVYKISVNSIKNSNGWSRIRITVKDVLKPGRQIIKADQKLFLWLPEICSLSVPFKKGKEYHIMGKDGLKFILDHTTHIEVWPSIRVCRPQATKACQEKLRCAEKAGKKKTKCLKKLKKCTNNKFQKCHGAVSEFEDYVRKLKKGSACDKSGVC